MGWPISRNIFRATRVVSGSRALTSWHGTVGSVFTFASALNLSRHLFGDFSVSILSAVLEAYVRIRDQLFWPIRTMVNWDSSIYDLLVIDIIVIAAYAKSLLKIRKINKDAYDTYLITLYVLAGLFVGTALFGYLIMWMTGHELYIGSDFLVIVLTISIIGVSYSTVYNGLKDRLRRKHDPDGYFLIFKELVMQLGAAILAIGLGLALSSF